MLDKTIIMHTNTETGFFQVTVFEASEPVDWATVKIGDGLTTRSHKSILCFSWTQAETIYRWCLDNILFEATA